MAVSRQSPPSRAGAPVGLDRAVQLVLQAARALPAQELSLERALGAGLAEDVGASAPVPAFDSSAMDGYAARSADIADASRERPVLLSVIDESRAGLPAARALGAGEAIAISTGAMIPAGADTVVRVEVTTSTGESVAVREAAPPGADVRRAGEDIRAGDLVLRRGSLLGAAELGVLASLGHATVSCARRARLSLLVSGDELVAPGEASRAGGVYDSNSTTIASLARASGVQVVGAARIGDDADATVAALAGAAEGADVLVVCGGVSVGAHDHVEPALHELGAREAFWGVALKPGRPTWFGSLGETLVFGLPGNPVSAMVTFILLVAPALRALHGLAGSRERASARMACDYEKPRGRTHAVRCRLSRHEDGWRAEPNGAQGSHVLSSMLGADALALVPAEATIVRAGELVEIVPLRSEAERSP
jgi:molybdopterin molybdotransferase